MTRIMAVIIEGWRIALNNATSVTLNSELDIVFDSSNLGNTDNQLSSLIPRLPRLAFPDPDWHQDWLDMWQYVHRNTSVAYTLGEEWEWEAARTDGHIRIEALFTQLQNTANCVRSMIGLIEDIRRQY